MARYMVQFSYNSEAVADLVQNPQNVAAQVSSLAESIGGRIESFYFSFGEYDGGSIGRNARQCDYGCHINGFRR